MASISLRVHISNIDEVLAVYNRLKIYRSDAVDGDFVEITSEDSRPRLVKGTIIYLFSDSGGSKSSWYKTSYFHSESDSESSLSDAQQGQEFDLDSSILSVQGLKDLYLFGIDLTDDSGTPYPDLIYEWNIAFATDWLEKELDIKILPTAMDERYDYYRLDFGSYMFLKLHEAPVISVESVSLQWPAGSDILTFPAEWISLRGEEGQINIVPTSGSFSGLVMTSGGSFLPLLAQGRPFVPNMIHVEYTAGFAAGKVPMTIRELIGKKASFGPLNIAGDLLCGAGIASQSIGIDGLSQSFNTTSSATNAGYGARLLQYGKEIKEQLETLKRYYRGIRLVVA